jgi:hypothetical protein
MLWVEMDLEEVRDLVEELYLPGTLPTTSGVFGSVSGQAAVYPEDSRASAPDGGRVLGCTKGGTAPGNSYWLNRGFSPCQDVGTVQFVNADGVVITNSAFINRGHKVGYAIRQTAGLGINGEGMVQMVQLVAKVEMVVEEVVEEVDTLMGQ